MATSLVFGHSQLSVSRLLVVLVLVTFIALVSFRGNDLTGTLDPIFCSEQRQFKSIFAKLEADCAGETAPPKLNCTCCTTCCSSDGHHDGAEICQTDFSRICDNLVQQLEDAPLFVVDDELSMSNLNSSIPTCQCTTRDRIQAICTANPSCPTCNEAETVCGSSIQYGWTLLGTSSGLTFNGNGSIMGGAQDDSVTTDSSYQTYLNSTSQDLGVWKNIFQYHKGRSDTISWEYDAFQHTCKVGINGTPCAACLDVACPDGYSGIHIDCRNAILTSSQYDGMNNDDEPLYDESGIYNSCSPPKKHSGVLDVFAWMESYSWHGCPFATHFYETFEY